MNIKNLSRDNVFMVRSIEAIQWEIENNEAIKENEIFSALNTALIKYAGRKVTFYGSESRERRFPQLVRAPENPDVVNVRFFVPVGESAKLISKDILRQLSVATVLACSFVEMVDSLSRNETYATFSKHHSVHARCSDELYHTLLKKFWQE